MNEKLYDGKRNNYDSACQYYKYLFEDLLHSPLGDHRCILDYQYDVLHGVPIDYVLCDSPSFQSCPRFLYQLKEERRLETKREEIVNSIGSTD